MGVLWTGASRGRKKSRPADARRTATVAAALIAIVGCSYMSDVKTSAPDLSAAALRSGKLAIMGVVQVDEVPEVRPPLVAALERVLRATRPDLPIVPAARVAPALDDSTERFLLLGYQIHGAADPAWLERAKPAIRPMARYALLARVETVKVRHADRVDVSRQSPGQAIQVTGRDVRVGVSVYDLESLALVFAGEYWGSKEDARSMGDAPLPEPEDSLGVVGVNDTTLYGVYTKPAPIAVAAEPAFVEFARSLPGAETASPGGSAR
jgi:hypothetical protein